MVKEEAKLATKHRRASMVAAAAEYGMKMRVRQMLEQIHGDDEKHRDKEQGGITGRDMKTSDRKSHAGDAGGAVSGTSQTFTQQRMNERIQARMESTLRAMLPEIASVVAAELKGKRRRRGARDHGLLDDDEASVGLEPGSPPSRSGIKSRPTRTHSHAALEPAPSASPAVEPPVAINATTGTAAAANNNSSMVAVHVAVTHSGPTAVGDRPAEDTHHNYMLSA